LPPHAQELFAGIGGFRVALDKLGGECVFASEVDHEARCTYAANFGDHISGDITEVEPASVQPFDVLTGGFPCQSHSVAGFQRGFDDFRGCLFFEVSPTFACRSSPDLCDLLLRTKSILSDHPSHGGRS
jgi:DNA (cytosine-5)-methyltransferase 1